MDKQVEVTFSGPDELAEWARASKPVQNMIYRQAEEAADLRQQLAAAEARIAELSPMTAGRWKARYDEAIAERDQAVKDAERLREWVCHNGGLIETWAQEWIPRGGRETLTEFIRRRLNAAIAAGGEGES